MHSAEDNLRLLAEAREHHRAGRMARAERLYRRVLEADPEQPDALNLLGVLAGQIGRFADACALIERAIAFDERNAGYLGNLGRALQGWGRHERAVPVYRRATALAPDDFGLRMGLASALRESGELPEAIEAYESALALRPASEVAHFGYGGALKAAGRLDEAIAALGRARELNPRAGKVIASLAGYLLERGEAAEALRACDECLAIDPRSTVALAFRCVALGAVGRLSEASRLLDFDRLLVQAELPLEGSPQPLHAFNRALAARIRAHAEWLPSAAGIATRGGRQTNELGEEVEEFAALRRALDEAVRGYLARLPFDREHPFLALRPRGWNLSVWAVVLDSEGHQLPHMHGDGWVSGVYYVELPEVVKSGDSAGWIEFGRPPAEFVAAPDPPTALVEPHEGTVVMFPSYTYHRTIPFSADVPRISVAFDALPIWE